MAKAPELLVPVFATGAGAAVRLKEEGRDLKSVVIMTDSFAHRMWVHEATDLFLVTSPPAAESVRRYWPEAPVDIITAPVRPEFYSAPPQEVARRALGVPADATCALLMSGAFCSTLWVFWLASAALAGFVFPRLGGPPKRPEPPFEPPPAEEAASDRFRPPPR